MYILDDRSDKGKLRIKQGGGHGGHNGVRDIDGLLEPTIGGYTGRRSQTIKMCINGYV